MIHRIKEHYLCTYIIEVIQDLRICKLLQKHFIGNIGLLKGFKLEATTVVLQC